MNTKVFHLNNRTWDKVGQTIYGEAGYPSGEHVELSGDASALVVGEHDADQVIHSVET